MAQYEPKRNRLTGVGGTLRVPADDEITRKMAMLIEGECDGLGPKRAAEKFGYSKQRYFQLRTAFLKNGALALVSQKRGPKRNHRRTDELVRQVIRHRFLDPEASTEVVAQRLNQCGLKISIRSVQRVVEEFGLQKKTLQVPPPG
jgi:transposase